MSLVHNKDLQKIILKNLAYELDKYEYIPIFLTIPILEGLPNKKFKIGSEYILKNTNNRIEIHRFNSPHLGTHHLSTIVSPTAFTIHPFTSYAKKGMGGDYKPPRSIIPVAANKKIKRLINGYIGLSEEILLPYAFMYLFFNRDSKLLGEYLNSAAATRKDFGLYKFCQYEYSIKFKYEGMKKFKTQRGQMYTALYDLYFNNPYDKKLPKFWLP